jgi:hypothetical protein
LIGGLFGEALPAIDFSQAILPDAISAQNNMAAVSARGNTVCVLILRWNSSCRRSIALDVRMDSAL